MTKMPPRYSHDDQVDALAYALYVQAHVFKLRKVTRWEKFCNWLADKLEDFAAAIRAQGKGRKG
jgi:hypothetical protein